MTNHQNLPDFQNPQQPPRRKRIRACLWGCLGFLTVLAAAGTCVAAILFLLPRTGITSPPAEVVYGAAPDAHASAQFQDVLTQSNLDGAKVYVIPERGTDTQTAFIILDSSAGFDGFTDLNITENVSAVDDRVDTVLRDLAGRNRTENLRIKRIAIDYRDENGETFMTLTTTMDEVEMYLDGAISEDEFYGKIDIGLGDLVRQFMEEMNE